MTNVVREVKDLTLPRLPGSKKQGLVEDLYNGYLQRATTSPPANRFPGLSQGII